MFATIGTWLAESALMTSPAGPFLLGAGKLFKKIPWQVWAAIGLALALWLGVRWHTHEIHKIKNEAYQAGYVQAVADVKAQQVKVTAKVVAIKQASEAKIDEGDRGVRKNAQDQNTHVDSNLARLHSMFANKAPRRGTGDAQHGVSPADGGASAQPADARADDGLAHADDRGQPPGASEPTITLPAEQLITRLGICDRDYIAVKAWEQSYANYMVVYGEWLAKTNKVAPPPQ